MASGIFVTGTDTGIGKTVVTRAITRALVRRGLKLAAVKPVESGAEVVKGKIVPRDAAALEKAAGLGSGSNFAYAFLDPLSPHLAAARAGAVIEPGPILELLQKAAERVDLIIAEGAGGLLVPLAGDLVYADVISQTGFKLVIVAPNVLGAINATLLTLEAARARNMEVAGVVLNRTPVRELGNADAIASHGQVSVLGEFPTFESGIDDDSLADLAEEHIDLGPLISRCGD